MTGCVIPASNPSLVVLLSHRSFLMACLFLFDMSISSRVSFPLLSKKWRLADLKQVREHCSKSSSNTQSSGRQTAAAAKRIRKTAQKLDQWETFMLLKIDDEDQRKEIYALPPGTILAASRLHNQALGCIRDPANEHRHWEAWLS